MVVERQPGPVQGKTCRLALGCRDPSKRAAGDRRPWFLCLLPAQALLTFRNPVQAIPSHHTRLATVCFAAVAAHTE